MQVGWKTLTLVPNVNSYLGASDVGQWNTKFAFKSLEKKKTCVVFSATVFQNLSSMPALKCPTDVQKHFPQKYRLFCPCVSFTGFIKGQNNLNTNLYPCVLNINVVISQTISRLWGRWHYWVKRVCFVPYRHCTSMKASAKVSLLYLLVFLKRKCFFFFSLSLCTYREGFGTHNYSVGIKHWRIYLHFDKIGIFIFLVGKKVFESSHICVAFGEIKFLVFFSYCFLRRGNRIYSLISFSSSKWRWLKSLFRYLQLAPHLSANKN